MSIKMHPALCCVERGAQIFLRATYAECRTREEPQTSCVRVLAETVALWKVGAPFCDRLEVVAEDRLSLYPMQPTGRSGARLRSGVTLRERAVERKFVRTRV